MPETLTVVTPWYPSPNKPFQGSFVESMVRAVRPITGRLDVLATEDWIAPRGLFVRRAQRRHYRDVTASAVRPVLQDGAWLTRLPVLVQPRRPWAEYARTVAGSVRAARGGRLLDAAVVHGHVGLPGGLVAVENAPAGARVVVTEHASYLAEVLAQPEARELYDETMHRADAWITVSGVLREQLLQTFPHHADKMHVVGNPVDFTAIRPREAKPERPRRWIYIGSLIERKGPLRLVAAFARCRREEPDLELTLLGDGAQRDEVRALIAELGVEDAVRILSPVPPSQVPPLITAHDLLVHPSWHETFGMTPVEALATGTPVLVARYAAAEEVLAGVEKEAGGLVDIGAGWEEIADGYRDLRDRWDSVDPFAAREVMRSRFGFDAVAARLDAVYRDEPATGTRIERGCAMSSATAAAASAPAAVAVAGPVGGPVGAPRPHPHVLVVSVTKGRRTGVVDDIRYILDTGSRVTFLCMRASEWPEFEGQVDFSEVETAEVRHPLLRAERGLVFTAPNLLLRYVAAVFRRARGVPGARVPAQAAYDGTAEVKRRYNKLGQAFHSRLFMRGYRAIRPWVLWRSTRSVLLPDLDLGSIDLVLLADAQAVSIGWHLARARPDLPVTFSLDRSALPPVMP
ncbi:MAG TPA: glycosyltransferase [Kineosporiaceae bacterium]|nr:glycosyltransferase [Kineosporiaceae bacterium]